MSIAIDLLVLRVNDLAAAERFYAALGLSFIRERHGNGPEHLVAVLGAVVLELYPRGDGPTTSGVRLGLRVPALTTVSAALQALGVPVTVRGESVIAVDPDGHRVVLTLLQESFT